ncbi:MAG: tRNA uridine-5-carboxymethylaminomethyl(34) synthesis GTPase MnmE [Candidatus Omnitrophica bacterium]|nr:tRNA uridine-5-carboxymethylaminomethyl(34) synthesis GTPase MnmE [Candidatus Omnitrophota bacterium]
MKDIKDTIAAISTPIGQGGIAIVRISGLQAIKVADKVFRAKDKKKLSACLTHTLHYGYILDTKTNEDLDEVLISIMKSPRTYTKEDIVEINCHGGIVSVGRVLEEVLKNGARLAEPGEFTRRAFLNGRIDLTQAEAVCDIITSQTEASLKMAVSHLEGGFSNIIKKHRDDLINILSNVESQIDFSYEDVKGYSKNELANDMENVLNELKSIFNTASTGILLKEGITCVICGKPNVGKSSLLNALLKRNRAIVTDVPGTTRDVIEEMMSISGAPVRLIDTAGITHTDDIVEREGVTRSIQHINDADIILFVMDLSKPISIRDKQIIDILDMKKTIVLGNKCDLPIKLEFEKNNKIKDKDIIEMSVLNGKNIKKIEQVLAEKIFKGEVSAPEPNFINNIRHKKAMEKAIKELQKAIKILRSDQGFEICVIELRSVIYDIGLITGESADINILDRIFSRFCIGK